MSPAEIDRTTRALEATEAAMAKPPVCPRCKRDAEDFECGSCELFRCSACKLWVSYTRGCADSSADVCDDCWRGLAPAAAPLPKTITVTMTVLEAAALIGAMGVVNVRDEAALAVRRRIHGAYLEALAAEDESSR